MLETEEEWLGRQFIAKNGIIFCTSYNTEHDCLGFYMHVEFFDENIPVQAVYLDHETTDAFLDFILLEFNEEIIKKIENSS